MDETFIGGNEKNKHAWRRTGGKQGGAGKIAVFGMLEREGELGTGVTLHPVCNVGLTALPNAMIALSDCNI